MMTHEQEHYFKYRAETHIEKTPEGCHLWLGPKNQDGYGIVEYRDLKTKQRKCTCIHRAYYAIVNDIALSRSDRVKHTCRNRACVNIRHLLGHVKEAEPLW